MMAGRAWQQARLMLVTAILASLPATAEVIHTVRLAAPPQALVWAGDGPPLVVTGAGPGGPLSGGALWPEHAFSALGGRFAIASNCRFTVDLMVPEVGLPDGVSARVILEAVGPHAEAGNQASDGPVALMAGATLRLLDWPAKTAARPGAPDGQALHFRITLEEAAGRPLAAYRRKAVLARLAVVVTPQGED